MDNLVFLFSPQSACTTREARRRFLHADFLRGAGFGCLSDFLLRTHGQHDVSERFGPIRDAAVRWKHGSAVLPSGSSISTIIPGFILGVIGVDHYFGSRFLPGKIDHRQTRAALRFWSALHVTTMLTTDLQLGIG